MTRSFQPISRFFNRGRWTLLALPQALVLALMMASCKPPAIQKNPITQLEHREDGLTYIQGSNRLYSGSFLQLGKNSSKVEEWTYEDGLLHGPNIRFNEHEGSPKRRIDYEKGVRVRKRCWYSNGQLRADEGWFGEQMRGMSTYWFDDGRIRKQMTFGDWFAVDGQIVEFDEDGSLLIDVIMDKGQYVGGYISKMVDLSDKARLGKRYFNDGAATTEAGTPEKQTKKTAKL